MDVSDSRNICAQVYFTEGMAERNFGTSKATHKQTGNKVVGANQTVQTVSAASQPCLDVSCVKADSKNTKQISANVSAITNEAQKHGQAKVVFGNELYRLEEATKDYQKYRLDDVKGHKAIKIHVFAYKKGFLFAFLWSCPFFQVH